MTSAKDAAKNTHALASIPVPFWHQNRTHPKPWKDTRTGKTADGLTRRPGGRWRVIGTQTTVTEQDQRRATEHFYDLKNPKLKGVVLRREIEGSREKIRDLAQKIEVMIVGDESATSGRRPSLV